MTGGDPPISQNFGKFPLTEILFLYKSVPPLILECNPTNLSIPLFQPAIKCSKLTIEAVEQGVKYVQS